MGLLKNIFFASAKPRLPRISVTTGADHYRLGVDLLSHDCWDDAFTELQSARKYSEQLSVTDRGKMLAALGLLHAGRGEKRESLGELDEAAKLFSGTGTLSEDFVGRIRGRVKTDDIGADGLTIPVVTVRGSKVSVELYYLMQMLEVIIFQLSSPSSSVEDT
jgi:hypothetical protein